jgi:DHA1 family inner membrane transport protein
MIAAAEDAPTIATAANIGAFNLGNALGAAAGAVFLSAGGHLAGLGAVGAAISITGLALFALTTSVSRPPLPASAGEVSNPGETSCCPVSPASADRETS